MTAFSGSRPLALITGAARSGRVGLANATALAKAACDILITFNHSRAEADAAVSAIQTLGATARADHIDLSDEPLGVIDGDVLRDSFDFDVRIQLAQAGHGRVDSCASQGRRRHQDLAIQIARSDGPRMRQDELSNSGGREVVGRGAADAADSRHENARCLQFPLADFPMAFNPHLPLVAGLFVRIERGQVILRSSIHSQGATAIGP